MLWAPCALQVGSKAGYYTSKSPQLHLQEWVQREKRPRMRAQPRRLDNGKWTCKVRGRRTVNRAPGSLPMQPMTSYWKANGRACRSCAGASLALTKRCAIGTLQGYVPRNLLQAACSCPPPQVPLDPACYTTPPAHALLLT